MSLMLLVGLPGSGKSYFADALVASNGSRYVRVCQDELGTKSAVESAVAAGIKAKRTVIVDKCNATRKDRDALRAIAFDPANVVAVHFTADAAACKERVATRVGHPTIPFGSGATVVDTFAKVLEAPDARAEGLSQVHVVGTFEESNALLARLGVSRETLAELAAEAATPGLAKFPRTPHLRAGPAVTRDDLIEGDASAFLGKEVTLEEKVDGANMGITLDPDTYAFVVQNRSHFVNSETHPQFKGLDRFLEAHSADLFALLDQGSPGRFVLYGEWCYAKHSVPYDRLPSYFLAYDLFDKKRNKFFSRAVFRAKLAELAPSISTVPTIAERTVLASVADLEALLTRSSALNSDKSVRIEGVYLRLDEGDYLVRRAKLVRDDFIQPGTEHWTKGGVVRNSLDPEVFAYQ